MPKKPQIEHLENVGSIWRKRDHLSSILCQESEHFIFSMTDSVVRQESPFLSCKCRKFAQILNTWNEYRLNQLPEQSGIHGGGVSFSKTPIKSAANLCFIISAAMPSQT
jgi:hypothetical protein